MSTNNSQEQIYASLRNAIEDTIGRKLRTPKDFDILAESISGKLHQRISPTTLKRLWGYLHDTSSRPRQSTLDLLARFIDYPSFDTFSSIASAPNTPQTGPNPPTTSTVVGDPVADTPSITPPSSSLSLSKNRFLLPALFLATLLLIGLPIAIYSLRSPTHHVIVRKGQKFSSYEEYQKLFGITYDPRHTYFVRLPEMPHIALWAPEYHHPTWHNEGDSAAMMPTITEYYHPADWPTDSASIATLAQINKERYVRAVEENEVRLVFMKDLVDTSFVFLGVYNLSYSRSDSTRVVFSRLADEVTDDLESLNLFRH